MLPEDPYSALFSPICLPRTSRNGSTLLNLSYDYAGPNGKRTGQLTKIYNNLTPAKSRGFEYDALGRLIRATGGQGSEVTWAQRYEYDRYGNRSNVYSFILEDYVRNFYMGALNRQPNTTELNNWLNTLRTAYGQGQSQFLTQMQALGQSLFTSQEYIDRNRTNEQFVTDLYQAFLYRAPDSGGYAYWVSMVPINGRDNIRLAFQVCPEFYTKVAGISPYAPSQTVPRDGLQGIAYNQATNRILNSDFTYDAAGNQTRALAPDSTSVYRRYQYDAANRLVHIKSDAGVVLSTHTYGQDNQRLMTEEFPPGTSERTYYVTEGLSVLAEYVESGAAINPSWRRSYVYLGTRLLSTMTPNGAGGEAAEYYHPDRLGTRIITNPSTGGSSEQVTLPFGTALALESSGAPSKQRFTSYDRSSTTALDYPVNRHYDSQQGRFTQVDPIGMSAVDFTNPQTLNLYTYCANDPINAIDSSGLGFLSFIKKLFRVIAKVIRIITAVVAVALAVLAVLALTWGFGIIALKLAIASAVLFAYAFGPPKLRMIIGALGMLAAYKPSMIIKNITNGGSASAGALSTVVRVGGALLGVGAIADVMGQERPGPKPQPAPEGTSAGKRISPCVKQLLGSWFPEIDLDKVRLFDYLPAYVRGDAEAYTEGSNIFFRDGINQKSISGIKLMGHELTHIRQQIRYPYSYPGRYIGNAAREILHGHDPAGVGNALEKEAYNMGDAIEKNLKEKFGSKNPCP